MTCYICKNETDIKSTKWSEPICLSCENMLTDGDERRKLFMKEYNDKHAACPKCGDVSYITTLMGFPFNPDDPDSYENLNKCFCGECFDKHTKHERVPIKDSHQ